MTDRSVSYFQQLYEFEGRSPLTKAILRPSLSPLMEINDKMRVNQSGKGIAVD